MLKWKRAGIIIAGGLAAALVLGGVSAGFAATTPSATPTQASACDTSLCGVVREAGGRLVDVVAKLTGQTAEEVSAQRAAGKTFAQVAADENVSATAVVDEAMRVRAQVLAGQVSAGKITQAEADAALSTMRTRLTSRITDPAACKGAGSCSRGGARAGTGVCAGGSCGGTN